MKYLSTFSGVGGFEIGIEKSVPRSECIGFSEIDKYATKVYKHHFPNHKEYGDISKIDTATIPDFDCLVGGFPCQSFSIAGKRGGFEDTRGTLFFELARILRDKRPRCFVFENVKGLLSHDQGNTFKTIIATLDELGYFVEWQVLNSKNFGVPQNRERVFIIGHLGGEPRRKVFPLGGNDGETYEKREGDTVIFDLYNNKITDEMGTLRAGATGGACGFAIKQLNQPTHSNDRVYSEEGMSPCLNTMQGGNRQPFVAIKSNLKQGVEYAEEGDSICYQQPTSKTRRGRIGKQCANTLDTGVQQGVLLGQRIRRLTPKECERLQGFPDNWTNVEDMSDSQRYKQCGNAVTVNVIEAIFERLNINLQNSKK